MGGGGRGRGQPAGKATRLLHRRYLPALAERPVTVHPTTAARQLDDDEAPSSSTLSPPSQSPATFDAEAELAETGLDVRFLRLSEGLHCHGFNIRHLGALRSHVLQHLPHHPNTPEVALLLLVEAVARALKRLLRQRLRACVEGGMGVEADERGAVVVDHLNLITGHHPQSQAFRLDEVPAAVRARFGAQCWNEEEGEAGGWQAVMAPHLLRVVSYLCLACGVALSPACEEGVAASPLRLRLHCRRRGAASEGHGGGRLRRGAAAEG